MNTRIILASLLTAAMLAACSSPTVLNPEDLGAQPTLEELNSDNDSSLELAGKPAGLGNLLVRKIYDVNQNGKFDAGDQGVPDWGVRIVSVDENGNPDDAADVQVTPWGSGRWRGVNLKVPYGRYKIEELEPSATQVQGTAWKVTGKPSRIVNVTRSNPVRAIEFAGVCLENGAVVKFPKIADFANWKCRATFDLLPRIGSFTATPDEIQTGGSSALKWNVLDYSKLEITPTVGVVKGFTGSKTVTPASTTAYMLKATNGFGSRTANVTVKLQSIDGVWTNAGNLKFLSGPSIAISLSENRVLYYQKTKAELFDFINGSSKELKNLPNTTNGWSKLPDQKLVTIISPTSGIVFDPLTDTATTVNTTTINAQTGNLPTVVAQLDNNTLMVLDYALALTLGTYDYPSFKYTKTGELPLENNIGIAPLFFIGLTKEKNALFLSNDYRYVIVNPRTGKVVSSVAQPVEFCLNSGRYNGFPQFGLTALLPNDHFLRVGGAFGRGGAVSTVCDYDPATNTYKLGTLNQRSYGQSFLLTNNKVLVLEQGASLPVDCCGKTNEGRADLYDPSTATSQLSTPFNQPRLFQASTQLSDGRVVIAGGSSFAPVSGLETPLSSIEIYTP